MQNLISKFTYMAKHYPPTDQNSELEGQKLPPYAHTLNPDQYFNRVGEVQINAQALFGGLASVPINNMYHEHGADLSKLEITPKNINKLVDLENKASINGAKRSLLGFGATPFRRILAHGVASLVQSTRTGQKVWYDQNPYDSYSHESKIIDQQ